MAGRMLALTLWRPWDTAILRLGKPVENRDWPPPAQLIGKRFALHSGKKWDDQGADFIANLLLPRGSGPQLLRAVLDAAEQTSSVILGTVKLVRVISKAQPQLGERDPLADSEWFFGDFGWVVEEPFALPQPVPCKGMQGLWTMPPDVEAQVLAQEAGRLEVLNNRIFEA